MITILSHIFRETLNKLKLHHDLSTTLALAIFVQHYSESLLEVNSFSFPESLNNFLLFFTFIIDLFLFYFVTKFALVASTKSKISLSELFPKFSQFIKYVVVSFLIILLVIFGLILLIIPGLYWGTKYFLVIPALIDKNTSIKEAFTESGRLTKGFRWKVFLIFLLFTVPYLIPTFIEDKLPNILVDLLTAVFGFITTFATVELYLHLKRQTKAP